MWEHKANAEKPARDFIGAACPDDDELELLRAALAPGDRAAAAWVRWRAIHDLDGAPDRSHEIMPAVGVALPDEVLGDDADRLRGLRRQVWVRNQLLLRALSKALRLLAENDVPTTVIKGAVLASHVYPDPALRRMGDTDFVVGPENFDRALEVLLAEGWTMKFEWFHGADLVDENDNGTDVHRWPLFPRFTREVESGWLDRSVETTIADAPTRRLAEPDELVMTLTHGLFAMPSPSLVRWPLDVAALLGAGRDDGFWTQVTRSAGELGVGPIVGAGLGFCRDEFSHDIPVDVVAELRASSWDGWLAYQWWRRTRGSYPPMRVRRYIDLERAAGRRPTVTGYVGRRVDNLREHGVSAVVRHRVANLRTLGFRPG